MKFGYEIEISFLFIPQPKTEILSSRHSSVALLWYRTFIYPYLFQDFFDFTQSPKARLILWSEISEDLYPFIR